MQEKVQRYDEAVLKVCGLHEWDELTYTGFLAMVAYRIMSAGLQSSSCGGIAAGMKFVEEMLREVKHD